MSDHVELSPSSASRWLACPGSIALSRGIPEKPSSAAAEEGTRAHAIAEAWLSTGEPDQAWLRDLPEMVEHVRHFVDFCQNLLDEQVERDGFFNAYGLEQKLTMDRLHPPAPMAGTADFICWSPERLDIVDLKYGAGVYVNEQDNPQLLYYAVMGMLWCEDQSLAVPSEIRITIVQPRMEYLGDIIRSVSYGLDDVIGFANTLLYGAMMTQQADVWMSQPERRHDTMYLNVGSHCRWCKALTICPAQKQNAVEVAQMDFDVVTPEALPAPTLLTNDELGGILARATWLGQWVDALQKEATERLGRNELVPGWKLAPKQARRKWIEDENLITTRLVVLGADVDEFLAPRKVKGIGDVEKLLKKKGAILPDGLTVKESSGFNLVPESSSRPSRNDIAASEFTVISSTTSQE